VGDAIQSFFDGVRERGSGGGGKSGNSGGSAGSGSTGSSSGGGAASGGGGVGFGGGGGGGSEGGGSGPSGGGGGGAGGGSSIYTGSTFSYINGHPYGQLPTMEISGPVHIRKISEWAAVRTTRAVEFQDFNMSNGDSYQLEWNSNGPLLAMAGDGDGDKVNMTADQILSRAGTGLGLAGYGWDATGVVAKSRPVVNFVASMTYSTAAETRSSLSLLSPAYKFTGKALFGLGLGISITQGTNAYLKGDYLGATKSGTDVGLQYWSLMNPATFLGGALYFGVDAFYPSFHNQPKGWPSALEMNSNLIQQNRRVVPGFNLYRD
jgi:hypothetical protein